MKVIHSYFIHTSKANDLLNSCRFYVKKVQSKQEHIDKRKEKDRVGKMSSQRHQMEMERDRLRDLERDRPRNSEKNESAMYPITRVKRHS